MSDDKDALLYLADVRIDELQAENAKLRDSLKALMMGTYNELCADRGEPQCKECFMRRGNRSCVVIDAMELLRTDVLGEPLMPSEEGAHEQAAL